MIAVIKKVEHRQNKSGVQQAIAVCFQARTPGVKFDELPLLSNNRTLMIIAHE
jgi:hypothetical protein